VRLRGRVCVKVTHGGDDSCRTNERAISLRETGERERVADDVLARFFASRAAFEVVDVEPMSAERHQRSNMRE